MPLTWSEVSALEPIRLNLGGSGDCDPNPLYPNYVVVDLEPRDEHGVAHDLSAPLPLADASVERVLSEHFLEHVPPDIVAAIFAECHRVLVPGGVARFAVPDYDHPKNRKFRERGHDPGHLDHVWFPIAADLRELAEASPFTDIRFHQHWDGDAFVEGPIDYTLGHVKRTPDHDPRNRCVGTGQFLARLSRDVGVILRRGPFVPHTHFLAQRYHRLRMTSIVFDLVKEG